MDLNLLVAFEALYTERSVTRAGRRLGLSQPATSGALSRLRTMLGDELFVRGRDGLVPTERCEELAAPVSDALVRLRDAVRGVGFDPGSSDRTFTLGVVDAAIAVVIPGVVARVLRQAPRVRLSVSAVDPARAATLLEDGALDLVVAPLQQVPGTLRARELFPIGGAVVLRKGHPLAKDGALTLDALVQYPSVVVSFVQSASTPVDAALATRGQTRHVAVVLTSFLAVPHVLRATDATAVLPGPFARKLEADGGLVTRPVPKGMPLPELRMKLVWSAAQDASRASVWLREIVADAASDATR